ncbi:TlpA family protein disulfide reductase [bacterium]|nr:MAG: TlpA family protein disulfide reductase [bacterium]
MQFSRLALAAIFSTLIITPASAQPTLPRAMQPRAPEAAPIINPEAKSAVDAMLAKYAALKSYSDKTQVTLEGGDKFPADMRDSFPLNATLSWQRPAELRFEGSMGKKNFLALSGDDTLRAINPSHPALWVERAQHPPVVVTNPDGTKTTYPTTDRAVRLDAPVFESGAMSLGLAFMTDTSFWPRTMKDVTVMALEPDAEVDGQKCRVINVQSQNDQGGKSLIHLWIAREDNMLRRMEVSYEGMGADSKLVENHSQIQADSKLPDSTWVFQPPAGAKSVEYFPNPDPHHLDPALKIGDALPTFSGDDLKGEPLELNSKSGKVTVVHFFLMGMGSYDMQTLQKLQKTVGSDKLQVVAVSGDALQGRLEKFAEKFKLTMPIYFDEGAMRNQLAQKFGVVGWSQTFIFGQDGKLKTICHMPGEVDFHTSIKKLLPETLDDAFIVQDNEMINPE